MKEGSWQFYLLLIALSLMAQGFFAMMEMACVSFNRIRLQFYTSEGRRSAILLSKLLKKPTYLFGVTLLAVNTILQFGSECSRKFYLSVGIDPDYAPITQVFIVLVFAEMVPMFIGRRYPERVASFGAPILFFLSWLFRPLILLLELFTRFVNFIVGAESKGFLSVTRDELQKVLADREETEEATSSVSIAVDNIFKLNKKKVKDLYTPLNKVSHVALSSTVGRVRWRLRHAYQPFVVVYSMRLRNVVGILNPRDTLRLNDESKIESYVEMPWRVSESTSLLDLLKDFRKRKKSVAIVLGPHGDELGVISLSQILDVIMGERAQGENSVYERPDQYVERTFEADQKAMQLNKMCGLGIKVKGRETLQEYCERQKGGALEVGEIVRVGSIEFTQVTKKRIKIRTL